MYGIFMSYGLSLGNIQMAWGIVGDKNTLSLNIFLVAGFEDQWFAGKATRLLRTLDPAKTTEIFQDPSYRNKKKGWIRNKLFSVEGRYNQVNMKLSLLERRLFRIQICLLLGIGVVSPSCMIDSWGISLSQTLIQEIQFLKSCFPKPVIFQLPKQVESSPSPPTSGSTSVSDLDSSLPSTSETVGLNNLTSLCSALMELNGFSARKMPPRLITLRENSSEESNTSTEKQAEVLSPQPHQSIGRARRKNRMPPLIQKTPTPAN
jgi:hypothetical protein